MNKRLYAFFLLLILLPDCKKDEVKYCYDRPDCIKGEWLWIKSCGGFTGGCLYPEDNQKKIVFTSDYMYIEYWNGVKVQESTYFLTSTVVDGKEHYKIFLEQVSYPYVFLDQILIISSGDFAEQYERIK